MTKLHLSAEQEREAKILEAMIRSAVEKWFWTGSTLV